MTAAAHVDLKAPTSLRFVAALMVFFCHFPPTRAFAVMYYFGESGVGFFFLLSGFILTFTYYREFAGTFSTTVARRFHLARIARVYPVHIVTMAICLAWFISFGAPQWNIENSLHTHCRDDRGDASCAILVPKRKPLCIA